MTAPAPPNPLAAPEPWDLVSAAYAEEVVPQFEQYAENALNLAGVRAETRVVDVACGPGTLALLAARRGATVEALDFSPAMIDQLRSRLDRLRVSGVGARVGDGQELPYADASFDAAFSMFGLMFFPDRARGMRELRRCLADGGTVVIGSWQPMETNVPFVAGLFTTLREQMPNLPFGNQEAPLSNPEVFADELRAAGFRDVAVHHVVHTMVFPSTAEGWASMERTLAPMVLLARKLGAAWPPLAEKMRAGLVARFGEGAQVMTMPAWLGTGRR